LKTFPENFANFCPCKGKTKSALNYLSMNTTGEILNPQDVIQPTPESDPMSVLEILEKQHPSSSDPNPEILLHDDKFCLPFNNIILDNLDGDFIKQAAI
jgi:aminoglycoside phosphotransferase